MRKTGFFRFFVLLISIALLIGSVAAITAGAEESDTYEITAMNISYGDRTYAVFTVDAPVADAEAGNVSVTYSYGGKTYSATYWKEITENTEKNPSGLPVFSTGGIAPKDLGEDIAVEAHKTGATDFTPDTKTVSVAKYLYAMLYREGRIDATSGNDFSKKELYESLLVYASKAQTALWNDLAENADNRRVLVTDRIYVTVSCAIIGETGASDALLYEAGTVTLSKTAEYTSSYSGWLVTTYNSDGTKTVTRVSEDTVAVSGHTVIAPASAEIDYDPDFEPDEGGASLNFEDATKYPTGAITSSSFNYGDVKLQKYGSSFGEGQVSIVEANGTKYLRWANGKAYSVNQSLQVYPAKNTTGVIDTTALEVRLNLTGTANADSAVAEILWRQSGTSTNSLATLLYLIADEDTGDVNVALRNPVTKEKITVAAAGEDFTLRTEYYWYKGEANIYVNGKCVAQISDESVSPTLTMGIERIFLTTPSATHSDEGDYAYVDFDYITVENITKKPEVIDPNANTFDELSLATGVLPSAVGSQFSNWGASEASFDVVEQDGGKAIDIGTSSFTVTPKNITPTGQSANATIFEVKLRYSDLSGTSIDKFYFRTTESGATSVTYEIWNSTYNGVVKTRVRNASGAESSYDSSTNVGEGCDFVLRVVYRWDTGAVSVMANGVEIHTATTTSLTTGTFESLRFQNSGGLPQTWDNVLLVNTYIAD